MTSTRFVCTQHAGEEVIPDFHNFIDFEMINILNLTKSPNIKLNMSKHGLRTPNEGINQSYLKNWADVADKICFGRT